VSVEFHKYLSCVLTGLSVNVINHHLKQENYSDNGLCSTQAICGDCVATTSLYSRGD